MDQTNRASDHDDDLESVRSDNESHHTVGNDGESGEDKRRSLKGEVKEGLDEPHQHQVEDEKAVNAETTGIGWDGPNDPLNPKNFSFRRRWFITTVVSFYGIVSPLNSSMVAPCVSAMSASLHVTKSFEMNMMVSVYLLGYVVGPFLLGPLSEVYGRRPILITSNLVFIAFNIGCSEAQTFSQMVAFRFLSGLGGSGPLSIGGGVLGDLWMAEQRGKAAALYSLGPLLGPSIGPVAGGLIADNISWRWTFRIVTIVAAISATLGAILLPETYAPVLLRRKVQRMRSETGNPTLQTIYGKDRTIQQRISTALIRPFILLFTQPIVIVLTLFQSCLYGTFYIILVTLTRSYQQVYHQSTTIASLHYLATGLGFIFGRQAGTFIMDRLYRQYKAKNGGVGEPEMRLINLTGAIILIPSGMIIYGWSLQYHAPWIVPDIALFLFGTGVISVSFVINSYFLDVYTLYAASALAASNSVRSIFGFAFPLFATDMYDNLGFGWASSLLALITFLVGGPGTVALYIYGPWLRARSTFAAGGGG